jgi:hypothetical protein
MAVLLIGEKENRTSLNPIPSFIKPVDSIQDKDEMIELLNHKLTRSEQSLAWLEYNKTLTNRMLRKINSELLTAQQKIEQ